MTSPSNYQSLSPLPFKVRIIRGCIYHQLCISFLQPPQSEFHFHFTYQPLLGLPMIPVNSVLYLNRILCSVRHSLMPLDLSFLLTYIQLTFEQ